MYDVNGCDVIIGGAGFIGSHLVEELVRRNSLLIPERQTVVIDNMCRGSIDNLKAVKDKIQIIYDDFTNTRVMELLFKDKLKIADTVYNLATVGLLESLDDPERGFMAEVGIAMTGAQLVRKGLCKRLIHFSSSEVYGDINRKITSVNSEKKPTTPYAIGKLAGQQLIEYYIKHYKTNAYIIIPFNNFGPRQTPEEYQGIIPKCIKQMIAGDAVIINGHGKQIRDYIYVKDTIEWALRLINFYPTAQRIFNISTNNSIRIKDLVEKIAKLGNWNLKIEYCDPRPGDELYLSCDVHPLIKLISFSKALKETIEYYKEYYHEM